MMVPQLSERTEPERTGSRPANVARYQRAVRAILPATGRTYARAWRAFANWFQTRAIAVALADDAALA